MYMYVLTLFVVVEKELEKNSPCPAGYVKHNETACQSKCARENPCKNGGKCVYTVQSVLKCM